ncbi:MAG: FtsW/RodA/SpoVE family cell cycle protein [Firmicutes bacterium]|nr:FtsW/RodA/SpoVE family cell cycle protein [Bacillota bacterium]
MTVALLALVPFLFRLFGLPFDRILYLVCAVLLGWGLAQLARLELAGLPHLAERQLVWLTGGIAAMAAGSRLGRDYLFFSRYRYLLLCASLFFLGLTIPFGYESGGARAWLRLWGIYLQPSELVRPFLLFFLAGYLGQHAPLFRVHARGLPPLWRRKWLWGPLLFMWLLSLLILLLQRDLGTAVLYFVAFLVLLYLTSGQIWHLLGGILLGTTGVLVTAAFAPHVRMRFSVWLDPLAAPEGAGFQTARSLFALGAGGLLGVGPGRGLPQMTPAVHTDLIFTVIGEELGLAGGLAVLLLYFLFLVRALALAARSRDRVGYLFGAGLAFVLGVQALLIIGGSAGAFPLTGITLPLMSYGGSSLVSTLFGVGILYGLGAPAEEVG